MCGVVKCVMCVWSGEVCDVCGVVKCVMCGWSGEVCDVCVEW